MLGALLGANLIALQAGGRPRGLFALGVASALTGTLLFPVWALWLARTLGPD